MVLIPAQALVQVTLRQKDLDTLAAAHAPQGLDICFNTQQTRGYNMKLFLIIFLMVSVTQAKFVKYVDRDNEILMYDDSGLVLAIPKDEENEDYKQYLKWLKKDSKNKPEKFVKVEN